MEGQSVPVLLKCSDCADKDAALKNKKFWTKYTCMRETGRRNPVLVGRYLVNLVAG